MLKKLKRRKRGVFLATLLLGTTIASASVYAATQDPWGPQWYTPYDGNAEANASYVTVTGLKWYQSSISEYDWTDAWEWEFRPNSGSPSNYWGSAQSFYTNLPNGYYEHPDPNDVTIGCHSPQSLSASTSYYGYLGLQRKSGVTYPTFTMESELGNDYGAFGDAVPVRYEIFKTNALINTDYYW